MCENAVHIGEPMRRMGFPEVDQRLGHLPYCGNAAVPGLTMFVVDRQVKCEPWYASKSRVTPGRS